jgi:outer membrane protein OmpA-like peptidoglycan-associated protein
MLRFAGRRWLPVLCVLLWAAGLVSDSRGGEQAPAPTAEEAGATASKPTCQGKARLRGLVFDKDGSEIDPAGATVLDVVVDGIKARCPTQHFVIEGHTDLSGSAKHNQELSLRRAEAVKAYFVAHGIAADRLSTLGYGSSHPLTTNPSPSAQAINRRVTLIVKE